MNRLQFLVSDGSIVGVSKMEKDSLNKLPDGTEYGFTYDGKMAVNIGKWSPSQMKCEPFALTCRVYMNKMDKIVLTGVDVDVVSVDINYDRGIEDVEEVIPEVIIPEIKSVSKVTFNDVKLIKVPMKITMVKVIGY